MAEKRKHSTQAPPENECAQENVSNRGGVDFRDYGSEQLGGVYDHSGPRGYRHGAGYGGFGRSPGEAGGGFSSGRSYSAEPGWGPGYGYGQSARASSARGYEGEGSYQSGYYGARQGKHSSGHFGAKVTANGIRVVRRDLVGSETNSSRSEDG